jgi:hypothetical protein
LDANYNQFCCDAKTNKLAYKYNTEKEFDLDAWVEDIYRNGKGKIDIRTVQKYATIYWDAVKNGYLNFDVACSNLSTPDGIMLQHLANNVYHFSVAKNYIHLQQLTSLINDNGRIREWKSYKAEADKLNLKFNKTWLKTEYDFALAGSTMASKWAEWDSRSGDVLLRYSTIGDARVRDVHRALEGVTLPKNHSFWNTHYPPNGWKCRCDVEVVPSGYALTAEDKIPNDIDSIPPMMRVNVGKEKLIFPKSHPYYKGEVADIRMPNFLPSITHTTPNGFNIYESKASFRFTTDAQQLAWAKIEHQQCIDVAKLMAELKNEDALLLPELLITHPFYNLYFTNQGYKFAPKIADILLPKSKTFIEVKSYRDEYTIAKMAKMLSKANKQASTVVIAMNHDIDFNTILKHFNIKMNGKTNIINAYVMLKNGILKVLK